MRVKIEQKRQTETMPLSSAQCMTLYEVIKNRCNCSDAAAGNIVFMIYTPPHERTLFVLGSRDCVLISRHLKQEDAEEITVRAYGAGESFTVKFEE